jgi:hypothetical protein
MKRPSPPEPLPVRPTRIRTGLYLAAALLASGSARAGTYSYTDGDFTSGWTHYKALDTTPGAAATFTSSVALGGFPVGNYQETTHTYADGAIVVAHLAPGAYNPAYSAVCTIDFTFLARHFTAPTIGGAVRVRLAVYQGTSTYHLTNGVDVTDDLWTSFGDFGATPTSFVKVDGPGPSVPDFSCSGLPMFFGYTTSNSANGGPWTKVIGIDDVAITVHHGRTEHYDDSFAGNPWSSTKVVDTSAGQTNSFSTATPPTGGQSGGYREVTHFYGPGDVGVAHMRPDWVVFPGAEAVYSIEYRYTANHLTAPPIGIAEVDHRIVLEQGGSLYGAPVDAVYDAAWTYFARFGLTANDFTLITGPGPMRPDFSIAGAPFTLGYFTFNSSPTPTFRTSGIDDLLITVRTSPDCISWAALVFCDGPNLNGQCPCGTPALGHGCPNSIFASGGRLVALGTPSIANDTLVLQATAMPNSSCLYFQGTATQAVQAFDGVSCVTGTVIRLGTKMNMCNSSQYPDPGNLKVSVRGQITTPGVYAYQVWYRNAANFCTPATANYTNGLLVNWVP